MNELDYLEYRGKKYPMAFTLNIMEELQTEYGSLKEWTKALGTGSDREYNIAGVNEFFEKIINEGIDIENEGSQEPRAKVDRKMAARIVSQFGLNKAMLVINDAVSKALGNNSKTDESSDDESEKNVETTQSQI